MNGPVVTAARRRAAEVPPGLAGRTLVDPVPRPVAVVPAEKG